MTINVCLDLPPQIRARPATTEANALHRNFHLFENRERVAQAESHALENGADNMPASVRCGQPDQRRARRTIEMRSALAHQIRRPQQAVGTWANFFLFGGAFVGRSS